MNLNWLKGSSNPARDLRKHEPGITSLALENHWKQAREVMLKSKDPESAITVISHFNQMISFLRLSREDPSSWTNCKEFWMTNRCSDKAIKWLHELGAQRCDKDDLKLVHTLQSLLELASEDGQLLGYVTPDDTSDNESDLGSWDGVCSLSTLLLELCISVDGRIVEAARKSFVLLIQLASKHPELENSISQEARIGVTNMTISGLSACFAQLPTFSPATSEQLEPFIQQLHFVDSVGLAATDTLSSTIADCFSKNFLHAVILPALTQDDGSRSLHNRDDQNDYRRSVHEEIAVVTSYLQIVCENISHPFLIKSLITFVMSQLLNTLLHRMNHPSSAVTVSTLGLLNVLLEFYCEDFWYETILRHLMPQNHLMVSQRYHRLPEVDFQEGALRFISLLPSSVTDVLGPETVSQNFLQYVNSEVVRWSTIDGITYSNSAQVPNVSSAMTGQSNMCSLPESTKTSSSNSVFPTWKYKYDGTDKLEGTSPPRSLVNRRYTNSNCNNNKVDEPKELNERLHPPRSDPVLGEGALDSVDDHPLGPLSAPAALEDKFTTISLQANSDEMNSIGIGMSETSFDSELAVGVNTGSSNNAKRFESVNEQSDGYSSMESGVMDNIASFGPFVDCLFNHLTNFTKLDPDVILMATELVSTLASSRIPLISSLFLDHTLTLQPSFRSFLLILNRIRLELDKSVRSQQQMLSEVWGQMAREVAKIEEANPAAHHYHPLSTSQSMHESVSGSSFHSSFSEAITDNIRKTINSKSLVAAMSAVFQRKPVPVTAGENHQESPQNFGNQGHRHVSGRHGSSGVPNPIQEIHRIMATRAIFFTHWLLELSAIATQLCWKRCDSQ